MNPSVTPNSTDLTPVQPVKKPPRVWPAILFVGLFWSFRFVIARVEATQFERFGGTMVALGVLMLAFFLWWIISRRTTWTERLTGLIVAGGAAYLSDHVAHPSMKGMVWVFTAVPYILTVWAVWWLLARKASPLIRTGGLALFLLITCSIFALLRMDGLSGELEANFQPRWRASSEELYLASLSNSPKPQASLPATTQTSAVVAQTDDWPAFRGAQRDSIVTSMRIATDWDQHPPHLLWRQPLGPGWSSPIVVAQRLFTQEQRGESELVVCRDAATGNEIWVHEDPQRFFESMSGSGPRATPTFDNGSLYTLGATGLLNRLDASTGRAVWARNISADSGTKPPIWGFASSPLLSHGLVIVYAGGAKGLLAYHADTGEPAWTTATGDQSYTSPHPAVLGGREQILFLSDVALTAVDPADGKVIWEHTMRAPGAPRSIQPHPISDTRILVSSETDLGTALLEVTPSADVWSVQRKWVSRALKPSFNDFVVQNGYAYGFDGAVFTCMKLEDGKRCWREGRYNHGQVLLLADQHLLLVCGEDGQVYLLRATPDSHQEIAHFQAVTGKTWAHPALARGYLYLRSETELAGFELPRP